jgi:hypothetical protein
MRAKPVVEQQALLVINVDRKPRLKKLAQAVYNGKDRIQQYLNNTQGLTTQLLFFFT